MSIKVLKYKQPLYESFDFDNEEADDKFDQDFADNLRKQKMLSNLPNLLKSIIAKFANFCKHNYGNPKYFNSRDGVHKGLSCSIGNNSLLIEDNDWNVFEVQFIRGTSVLYPDSVDGNVDCVTYQVSLSNSSHYQYPEFYDKASFIERMIKLSQGYGNPEAYIRNKGVEYFRKEAWLEVNKDTISYINLDFLDELDRDLAKVQNESFALEPLYNEVSKIEQDMIKALPKLFNWLKKNDYWVIKGKKYPRKNGESKVYYEYKDVNFKKILGTDFMTMKNGSLYFSSLPVRRVDYFDKSTDYVPIQSIEKNCTWIDFNINNKLLPDETWKDIFDMFYSFSINRFQIAKDANDLVKFKDLIKRINQICK